MILGIQNKLYKIKDSTITQFTNSFEAGINSITLDANGNIYAGLFDRNQIVKINQDGTHDVLYQDFTQGFMGFIYFDKKNNSLIVFIEGDNKMEIWKTGLDGTGVPAMIYQDSVNTSNHGTVDQFGNIYFYDYRSNSIYKINEGTFTKELFFTDVVKSRVAGDPIILYSSAADGIIVGLNDDLLLLPSDGSAKYTFAENYVGIDNVGLYETSNGSILCTHTGQLFEIFKKSATSAGNDKPNLPNEYRLLQNYPNPFNPSTTISFTLSKTSDVSLVIYEISGRKVIELLSGLKSAGNYNVWFNPKNMSSGVYLYILKTKEFVETKKMIYLK